MIVPILEEALGTALYTRENAGIVPVADVELGRNVWTLIPVRMDAEAPKHRHRIR